MSKQLNYWFNIVQLFVQLRCYFCFSCYKLVNFINWFPLGVTAEKGIWKKKILEVIYSECTGVNEIQHGKLHSNFNRTHNETDETCHPSHSSSVLEDKRLESVDKWYFEQCRRSKEASWIGNCQWRDSSRIHVRWKEQIFFVAAFWIHCRTW